MVIPKRYSIRQSGRLSSHSWLSCGHRTYGCRDVRPGLHPCLAIFAVSAHFSLGISRAKAMGKRPFLQLVPSVRYASRQPGFAILHSPGVSSTSCENLSPLLAAVQAAGHQQLTPLHGCGQTERQTTDDRQTHT